MPSKQSVTQDSEAPAAAENDARGHGGDGGRREPARSWLSRHAWNLGAGVCLILATALVLMNRIDQAFVVGTLGLVAWFWAERNRLQRGDIQAAGKSETSGDESEEYDEQGET